MAVVKMGGQLTEDQIEELADRIYRLFAKNGIWSDTVIYFNGGSIDNRDEDGNYHYDGSVYHHEQRDPHDYFKYVNPEHILSMSFEGPVYHAFNYGSYPPVKKQFDELLRRFGLYAEQGDAWNLTCFYAL